MKGVVISVGLFLVQICQLHFVSCNTGPTCISSCDGLDDGKYQSCETCDGYIRCTAGVLEERNCKGSRTWDDNAKKCRLSESTTCSEAVTTMTTGPTCVNSCDGLSDGKYQSCQRCDGFIKCTAGVTEEKNCKRQKTWDDNSKECKKAASTTCTGPFPLTTGAPTTAGTTAAIGPGTGPSCIRSCDGLEDDSYQSCETCRGYIECTGEVMEEKRCFRSKTWDDILKECKKSASTTCTEPEDMTTTTTAASTTASSGGTGPTCIRSCEGRGNGKYQSCFTCSGFIKCVGGETREKDCDGSRTWHDNVKDCKKAESTTCTEPGTTTPPDVSPCESAPCLNGGYCKDNDGSYECICINDYYGVHCENSPTCRERACENGGRCERERRKINGVWYETYFCICTAQWGGQFCELKIDLCAGDPCQNGGTCLENQDGYYCLCGRCSCFNALAGDNCENADDLTSCQEWSTSHPHKNKCNKYRKCTANQKEKIMDCPNGWIYNIDSVYEDGDFCINPETDPHECYYDITTVAPPITTTIVPCSDGTCENGGVCLDTREGFLCMCDDEYYGDHCEIAKIHCDEVVCIHGTCVEIPETGFSCQCDGGYDGEFCQREEDECADDQCSGFPCEDFFDDHQCDCGMCKCADYYTDPTRCWPPPGGCHQRSGNFPHNENCNMFVECFEGSFVANHTCPVGEVFNPFTLACATYPGVECADSWYEETNP